MTVPAETIQESLEDQDQLDLQGPWALIVWNDPINLMNYVTYVFQKIFGYNKQKATNLMLDVHQKGRAHVYSGSKPEAEKYLYQLHALGLWETMEQA